MKKGNVIFEEGKHFRFASNGCWEWLRCLNKDGYGGCNPSVNLGQQRAHRAMLVMFGVNVVGMVVHHRCNNRKCVNPYHLHVGTQQHNVEECVKQGRFKSNKGELNPRAVLTKGLVDEMRYLYSLGGVSYRELALRYNVGKSTVANIIMNLTWREA